MRRLQCLGTGPPNGGDPVQSEGPGPQEDPSSPPARPNAPAARVVHVCTRRQGTGGFGGDFGHSPVPSKEACCALCIQDPLCTVAVFEEEEEEASSGVCHSPGSGNHSTGLDKKTSSPLSPPSSRSPGFQPCLLHGDGTQ